MDNADRTADMMYVRISCKLDASLSNSRISQEHFHVQLCLKLPQSSYNSNSKITTKVDTPSKEKLTSATTSTPMVGTNLIHYSVQPLRLLVDQVRLLVVHHLPLSLAPV